VVDLPAFQLVVDEAIAGADRSLWTIRSLDVSFEELHDTWHAPAPDAVVAGVCGWTTPNARALVARQLLVSAVVLGTFIVTVTLDDAPTAAPDCMAHTAAASIANGGSVATSARQGRRGRGRASMSRGSPTSQSSVTSSQA
jgi:hypothetical protein